MATTASHARKLTVERRWPGRPLLLVALVALFCMPLLLGCQSMMPQMRAPLEEEGEVLLYLQPFPQRADRLRFTIEAISARRSDGAEFPVLLKFSEVKGKEMTRQRFLGEAQLPPGTYVGLTMKVRDAFLRVEDGEAGLLAPDVPVRMDFSFSVGRRRGQVLLLTFQPLESLTTGFSFTPVFSMFIPPRPLAGLSGYVTNGGSNNITIFDKKTGQVAGVISMGGGPAGMALNQRGMKVYAAIPTSDTIEVIDIIAGDIVDKMRLPTGDRPRDLALAPDGKTLLSVNTGSNTVSFIDAGSLTEQTRVTVGNGPAFALMDPNGRRAYIFNSLSSTISVLDMANKALVTTIGTDPGPLRGQFNRRGDAFYVIHEWSPYVSIIDPMSLSIKRMSVTMGMVSIKVDSNTDLVYLSKTRDTEVGIYEPLSFVPIDFIAAGAAVTYVTIDGDMNNLLMVSPDRQQLIITSLISKKILSIIDVGEGPYWVTVMGER